MAHDLTTAIGYFELAIKLAPNDPEPLTRRASATYATGDYETAAAFAEKALTIDNNYAPALDVLGTIGLALPNYPLAKAAYDREVELTPNDVIAKFHHFQYFLYINAQPEALQDLEKLLALPSTSLESQFTSFHGRDISFKTFGLLERATLLESMGRLPEALKAFDNFVEADPGEFSYGWRGWYYINRDQLDLAQSDLDKALSYAPRFSILHNLKGLTFFRTKQYDRAIEEYTRAVVLNPGEAAVSYWMRAMALRALGRVDEAEVDALKAVSTDANFRDRKLKKLSQLGYFAPVDDPGKLASAIQDAVKACMLDERCS
jgi:tetratricopeptide (TPR) repeat protein